MHTRNWIHWAIATFAILLSSCVNPIEIRPAIYPIFVECILQNNDTQTLTMRRSSPLGLQEYEAVENATAQVSMTDESGVPLEVYSFAYQGNGEWTSSFCPHGGAKYLLEIRADGNTELSAELTFPKDISIDRRFHYAYEDVVMFQKTNQQYYDQLHSEGKKDVSELIPGPIYKLNHTEPVVLLMCSDYLNYKQETCIATSLQTSMFNKSSIELRRDNIDYSGQTPYHSDIYYYSGKSLTNNFAIAHIEEYDNGLDDKLHALSFDHNMTYQGVCDTLVDANKYFMAYGGIYINDIEGNTSVALDDTPSFYSITVGLEEYLRMVYIKSSHQRIEGQDTLDNMFSGDDIYTNITGGYGIFGGAYKARVNSL